METKRLKRVHMPIGYRFCPTDEEIIIHYLRPKVLSFPLPSPAVIHSSHHHHHLLLHHPATLPGDPKEKRYFFCKTSFHHRHHHPYNASTSSPAGGYWKPITKNQKLILATGCNHPIGFKKSFVFHQFSDHPTASRTPWVLHQFRLLYPSPLKMEEEWVVCSIQFKSNKPRSTRRRFHQSRPDPGDDSTISDVATELFGPPQPAASTSSSGITFNDDMDDGQVREEESTVSVTK